MTEGDFTPNKPGWYTAQNVAKIEDFEQDQYGNTWFNVKFEGDAETYLWLAKNTPEESKKYYGHLEPTKSGKRLRFKTDKVPDDERPTQTHHKSPETEENIARAVALKAAVEFLPTDGGIDDVLTAADVFLTWLKGAKPVTEAPEQPESQEKTRSWDKLGKKDEVHKVIDGEPASLDDIPY